MFLNLDVSNVKALMEYCESVNNTIYRVTAAIAENGSNDCDLIGSLSLQLKILEHSITKSKSTENEPYINGAYNPDYGDDRICKCGHIYERHFDSYDKMAPVGCKYCACDKFEEMTWADLSIDAKGVLEWSDNIITGHHDIMEIKVDQYFDRPSVGSDGNTHILITTDLFNEISKWCTSHNEYIIMEKQPTYLKFVLCDKTVSDILKIGDKVEFVQEGMDSLLHGQILEVNESNVKVKCKNGNHRYPSKDSIIRIM